MKSLIIGNWKMNPANSKEAFDIARAVTRGLEGVEVDAVLCPPFVYIPQLLPSLNVSIGAQDSFWEQEGAYTGEISPQMLKNLGCSYVILGHSERKQLGETTEMVAKKIQAALEVNLIPAVCIGENVKEEITNILKDIQATNISKIVFVYEPEGAISTEPYAKPASLQQVKSVLNMMRDMLSKKAGNGIAKNMRLLYGGSVSPKNIQEFMGVGAQGALVGAVSLNAQEFIQLAKNAISR